MDFFKKNLLSLGLGIVGLLLLLVGIFSAMVKSSKPPASVEIIPASESESVKIYVHVAGAVANPGLYLLNPEARVNDALLAAGGLNDQADQDYLAKNINLALKLTDGVKLYIPFKEELGKGTVLLNSQGQVAGDTVNALSGVNINTAESNFGINLAPNPGAKLSLAGPAPYYPAEFRIDQGALQLKRGVGSWIALTGRLVEVTNLTFTNLTDENSEVVQFILTVRHRNPSGRSEWAKEASFETSVQIRK